MIARLQETLEQASKSTLYADAFRDIRLASLDDFKKIPLTTRADLVAAGIDGTRAAPIEEICHYG